MTATVNISSQLRWHSLWLSLGILWILLVILLSLTPPLPKSVSTFHLPYADKIVHFITYFSLMFWFAQLYHQPHYRRYWLMTFIFLGFILEILQGMTGMRQTDSQDALANILGCGLAWYLTRQRYNRFLLAIEKFLNINSDND